MKRQMNKTKENQQKSKKKKVFSLMFKNKTTKRMKTKTEMHKPFHHFFFVVPTLIGFLAVLEIPFFILSGFLEIWRHPSNSFESLGNRYSIWLAQYLETNKSSSNLEDRVWVTDTPSIWLQSHKEWTITS